tara:strand:+ start:2753 stop:3322 length:570 start_codon:yes stop_codon:yes gene_type:complete
MSFFKHLNILKDAISDEDKLKVFNDMSRDLAYEILTCARNKKLIVIFGNGGSAADADHWSAELIASYEKRSRDALPVISLCDNLSAITAIANDNCFENIFSRQIEAFRPNLGIAIGLSTSGKSQNVINALNYSKSYNAKTVLITGSKYQSIGTYNKEIIFNTNHVGTIQTLTQIFYHSVSEEVEKLMLE